MCRNITTLRGLEPAATAEEIEAAAGQFVRKVTGVATNAAPASRLPAEQATAEIAAIVTRLLDELPARRVPPKTIPPLRRPEVQARIVERMRAPTVGVPPASEASGGHERMHELGIPHTH